MSLNNRANGIHHGLSLLGAALLVASTLAAPSISQATEPAAAHGAPAKPAYSTPVAKMPKSAKHYYAMTWGVDEMSARLVESGALVRFDYRIVDATKALPLHDRASQPMMLDAKAHAILHIPVMEKVGPMRQSTRPILGKSYWMTFSNKGGLVKAGHRVSVEIGPFRVDGLVVQ